MGLTVDRIYSPLCLVEIYKAGNSMNCMPDLRTVTTTKRLSDLNGGRFTLTINNGKKWHDALDGDEYVIIRGARQLPPRGNTNPKTWPVLMSGQLATVSEPINIGGSHPEWIVQCQGSDAGAWVTEAMVDYHDETFFGGGYSNMIGLEAKYGIQAQEAPAASFFSDIIDKVVGEGLLTGRTGYNPKIQVLRAEATVPSKYLGNGLVMQPYSGSASGLLKFIDARPFTEMLIVEGSGETPVSKAVYRLCPITASGTTPAFAEAEAVARTQISLVDIIGTSLAKAPIAESFSWYFTYPSYAGYTKTAAPTQIVLAGNPYSDAEKLRRYGFKPLEVECPIVSMSGGLGQVDQQQQLITAQSLCAELTQWLVAVYQHNDQLRSGQIQLVFMPHVAIGTYLVNSDTKREAYIEAVSHQIDIATGMANTTVSVSRERAS